MSMWEGGGRLINRLSPCDQCVPGSVELMTLRARRSYAPARLFPATSATRPAADGYRHDSGSRETQSAGLRRPAIRWAAVFPVQAPQRWGSDPLRTAALLTACLTGGALSAAARIGRVGELAGRLAPVSPAQYPSAALLYARPAA